VCVRERERERKKNIRVIALAFAVWGQAIPWMGRGVIAVCRLTFDVSVSGKGQMRARRRFCEPELAMTHILFFFCALAITQRTHTIIKNNNKD
jgi:hypothetical protein